MRRVCLIAAALSLAGANLLLARPATADIPSADRDVVRTCICNGPFKFCTDYLYDECTVPENCPNC
jgi:hypothetical protein